MKSQIPPDLVAKRAYQIWEEAGRPEGMEQSHWHLAEGELVSEARLVLEMQAEEMRALHRHDELFAAPQMA